MLPDDLPDNVIPLRPRQPAKRLKDDSPAATRAVSPTAATTSTAATPIKLPTARPSGEAIVAASLPLAEPTATTVIHDMTSNAARQQLAVSLTGAAPQPAVPPQAPGNKITDKLTEKTGENTRKLTGKAIIAMPSPSKQFSWRHLLQVIAGAFVLGVVAGWGAIALGAHVLGVWPHGFALYAMMIGAGVTMALTAALMSMLFFSDSSGHDDSVYRYQPENRNARDRGEPE